MSPAVEKPGGSTSSFNSISALTSTIVGALLLFSSIIGVHGIDDGRLCCRYRDKSFKPTGITYIPTLDSILAVDRLGYTQFVNLTDSKCGERYCGDSARDTPKDPRQLTDGNGVPIIFEGATTKDDPHLAYLLEGGRSSTGPPKIHFFDMDSWSIFHTVELPDMNVTDTKGAGSLVWIPDGHADGRFLVGSHIDGTVHAYRVSSDTSFSDAKLIDTFKLSGLPPEALDMSGMAFDFDARKLFTLFRENHWTMHAHHVEDDGTVAANLGSKWVNGKTTIGGSPPFKHEGIAVYRDRFEGSYHNVFIADSHRYIYNIRWIIGSGRLIRCPWVGRRVIGCCFTDQPCQNMATDDCWASGGFYVGKQCDVNTCASTAFDEQIAPDTFVLGCPNSTYFEDFAGSCHLCDNTNRGGKPGCLECSNSLLPLDPENQLLCTSCNEGYYLDESTSTCKPCTEITSCSSCGLNALESLECFECSEGSTLVGNECISCSSPTGTPNCSLCSSDETQITCEDCDNPFYLSDGVCESCASQVEFCAQCDKSLFGVRCEICADGFKLHQNECVAECPLGFYATEINRGQEIEPGSGCGSPKGPGLDPVWVCNQCKLDTYNVECSAVPPVPSSKNCTALDWPSNLSGEDQSICSGAVVNDRCLDGSFAQAQQLCSALGARLCTRGELLRGEGLLSGCGEHDRVWTSSRNDGCDGWFAITTARSGDTSIEDSLCTRANLDAKHGVQCCADGEEIVDAVDLVNYPKSNELYDMGNGHATCWLLDWSSTTGSTQSCARSQINDVCYDNVTWAEAEEVCASVGSHVCRMEELSGDLALDTTETGCGFDNVYVWSNNTSDQCPESNHLVGGGSGYAQTSLYKYAQCADDEARFPVRCCTYSSVEGQEQLWDLIDQCVFGIIVYLFGGVQACVTETHTPGGSCYGNRPFNEAQDVCDMQSGRLCTSAEISAQQMLNPCTFQEEKVWTLDDTIIAQENEVCPENHYVTRAGTDTYLWKHPEECSSADDTLANVVCCQGPVPVDPCLNVTCPTSTNDCTSEAVCISNGVSPEDYECIEVDVSAFQADMWICGDGNVCTGQLGVCDASVDPCDTISCFQENECREVGVCEDGFCTSPMKTNGTACGDGQGICAEGECVINSTSPNPTSVTAAPTSPPTGQPVSAAPTPLPTGQPVTAAPTSPPTGQPVTAAPTSPPTGQPVTAAPTSPPTSQPSANPTPVPTGQPVTSAPTSPPTGQPVTADPTSPPTSQPSANPTPLPTGQPVTAAPTSPPTGQPVTAAPTSPPTSQPSANPTPVPTSPPTGQPVTAAPTSPPTGQPVTAAPTSPPTSQPSANPTPAPTGQPVTAAPTSPPTEQPVTAAPTSPPTGQPVTAAPTSPPTGQPVTTAPTSLPTSPPSANPTPVPTNPVQAILKHVCAKRQPLPDTICAEGVVAGYGGACFNENSNDGCGNGGKVCWWAECGNTTSSPTPTSPVATPPPTPLPTEGGVCPVCAATGEPCCLDCIVSGKPQNRGCKDVGAGGSANDKKKKKP